MNKSNVMNWIKKARCKENSAPKQTPKIVEMDELYWFLKYKPRTETRENIYLITLVSRNPRQILGYTVSPDKSAETLQKVVDMAPYSETYCTDGYNGYLDTIFPGKHIFNPSIHIIITTPEGRGMNNSPIRALYQQRLKAHKNNANRIGVIFLLF